ncbi:MAG: hypothetical protein MJ198_08095 [Bacteroidales bacterium]|nr:hypothetical protein [Bacteroidales bacterium]
MKNKAINFLEYILIFLVVIGFSTPYLVFPMIENIVRYVPLLILFLLCVLRQKSIKFNSMFFLLLVGAVPPLINLEQGALYSYVRFYMLFLPMAYLYLNAYKKGSKEIAAEIFFKYSNLVTVIALLSLFYWCFGTNLGLISSSGMIPYEWDESKDFIPTYHGLYFETQMISFLGLEIHRNSGIFCEAPMFNMILCVSLIVELYIREKKSSLKIILLIITILTTFSTTGQIILLINLFVTIYLKMNSKLRIFLLLLMPLVIVSVAVVMENVISSKMDMSAGEHSVNSRINDIVVCIEKGSEHPFFGESLFHKLDKNSSINYGYSNSIFTLFAHGGLYTVSLYLFALLIIPLLHYHFTKKKQWMFFMILFFGIFAFTGSQYRYLTILFVAWGLTKYNKKEVWLGKRY